MITDVFLKRYRHFRVGERALPVYTKVFRQIATIVAEDISAQLHADQPTYEYFAVVEKTLRRELGRPVGLDRNPRDVLLKALYETHDVWNDLHGTSEQFVAIRMSITELLFREYERLLDSGEAHPEHPFMGMLRARMGQKQDDAAIRAAMRGPIDELNARFRENRIPFHYHNGLIQIARDDLTDDEIAQPFWGIVSDAKWKNVDTEMKEALDRRDAGKPDAAFHAMKALESVIKIISDQKGSTTGKEKGAANYIDNLVSAKNDRLIEVWEADLLKGMFKTVRNPHGHGAGSDPAPIFSNEQTNWAIESAMSWIKSLVRRS